MDILALIETQMSQGTIEGSEVTMFFTKRKRIEDDALVTAVVTQTAALITDLHKQMDFRFKELTAQVREVELGLAQLEAKLLAKDLKDKQAYGLLHYKLHEAKNPKLQEEIADLEKQLKDLPKA